jgi:deazaflavin-dependent oxidoreductase (nitroreductase family)
MPDFNDQIIAEFRQNHGRVGGPLEDSPVLLLHHVGAKSGTERVSPLIYLADGDRYVVFASKAGAPENPGWYHNLKSRPETVIEVGPDTVPVVATVADPAERNRLFARQIELTPDIAEHQERAGRTIPVVILSRAA